ncbi:MAG: hypothetical protein J7J09_00420 [Kosmotoga sp.]|uniref:DUF5693 family protein n=1 Tax=Kosmotoga sp. TaxID=1955248 RepID=UPI0025C69FCF|nr:DUF5693 family protein [Kosmotoga sp.]MCD6159079.1 hypothetical protein [Kosmotoga sp.]
MAGVRIRSKNPKRRGIKKTTIKKRSIPPVFVLFLLLSILLLLYYFPDRSNAEQAISNAAILVEEPVDGVQGFLLDTPESSPSTSKIILLDLSKYREPEHLKNIFEKHKTIILTGASYFKPEELAEILDRYRVITGFMEFDERGMYVKEVIKARKYPELVFRVHQIKPKEYPNYDLESAVFRYIRAVRERSVDVLLFMKGSSETLSYTELVKETYSRLKEEKLLSNVVNPSRFPLTNSSTLGFLTGLIALLSWNLVLAIGYIITIIFSHTLSLTYLAIFGSISLYFLVMKITKRQPFKPWLGYILIFVSSLGLGMAINAQMVSPAYQNGILLFRGVKFSLLVLPALVFVLEILRRPIKKLALGDYVLLILFILGGIYYLLRSGNYSLVLDIERRFRDFLDNLLIVRPRFKEIIGYPFLILSIYGIYTKNGLSRAIVASVGSIPVVSVVNTFCHATAPLWTLVLRSTYGFVFGSIIGLIVYYIIKFLKSAKTRQSLTSEVEMNRNDAEESNKMQGDSDEQSG